jgi:DNA-binding MarR family transcriptional regulator
MHLSSKTDLLRQIAPPVDALLASQLIDEYVSLERRFILRDWEPAELDGGQFCEVLARILYHLDSGNLNVNRQFGECLDYIENDTVQHLRLPRKEFLHIARVLRTVYKFRSDRGAVHIAANYSPNHMDSRLILENVRWSLAETLRLVWNGDREEVAKTIRHLLQFDTPCIGIYGDRTMVQRTDLKAEEELLVLFHHWGEEGIARLEIGKSMFQSPSTVTNLIRKLEDSEHRQIVQLPNGNYRLTDIGATTLQFWQNWKMLADSNSATTRRRLSKF